MHILYTVAVLSSCAGSLRSPLTHLLLLSNPLSRLRVRNVYFEATPLALVAAVLTEDGAMGAAEIERLAERRRATTLRMLRLQL